MINYSAQDVWYLPRAYRVFWEKATKFQSSLDCDLIGEVFKESRKCNIYAYINMNCKNLMCCKAGQYLTAFLKNFQKFCIYWSLNLGCTGVVLDQKSIKFIKTYFQMGDMLNLEISRIDLEDKKMVSNSRNKLKLHRSEWNTRVLCSSFWILNFPHLMLRRLLFRAIREG